MSKSTVATPNQAYLEMSKHWALPDDLSGGTLAMRAAGTKWLPRESKESDSQYSCRLERSILFNSYCDTLEKLVGKPFSRPLTVQNIPKMSPRLEDLLDDVNGEGCRFQDFAKECFEEAIHRGLTHILVDYSSVGEDTTQNDVLNGRVRPFMLHISPINLIGWKYEATPHGPVLTEVRIKEDRVVPTGGWEEKIEHYVRVIRIDDWELFKESENSEGEKVWISVEWGRMTLGYIPLITVYFNRTGVMAGTPCLEDLSWLNLAHWQSYSDQRNILRFARTGLLFIKGLSDDDMDKPITIGPNQAFKTTSEDADMKFVELGSGGALEAGERDIRDLEEKMCRLGMRPLTAKSGMDTATGKAIDEKNENTDIHCWIQSMEIALEKALHVVLDWRNIEPDLDKVLTVNIYNEFALSLKSDSDLNTLNLCRQRGDITRVTFLTELQRRAVISDTIDVVEENKKAISEMDSVYAIG